MDPIVWIVIGVIALIVVIALIAAAVRSSNRRKLTEAADLRRDARQREQQLERQHAVAREHEHRAEAAEQEAKAKAAEAEKLRVDAEQHRSAVDEQKRDVSRMEEVADKLDPRHRAEDRAGGARTGRGESVTDGPQTGDQTGGRHAAGDDGPGRPTVRPSQGGNAGGIDDVAAGHSESEDPRR